METPNFIFSSGQIELKEEADNFFVEGYVSTSDLDLVNDIVTKDCIMDMAEQMKSRTIKLDIEHESFRGNNEVELEINKTIIPAAKIDEFLVDKKGLKIKAMLNKHVQRFNEIKNSIKDGFLDAFSIAFIPTKARMEKREGQMVRLLDKISLLNVAFTGNPVNTHSTMTNVFAKSLEYLKEKEKISKENHDHVSDNIIKLKEVKKMSEEDNKEETQEAEKVEEKPSESESESEEEKAKKRPKEKPKEDEEEEETKKKKVSKKDEDDSEESKEESTEESSGEKEETEAETKSEISKLKKDMMEVKTALKKPLLKSKVEQTNKELQNVEEKSLNPLDIIA